MNLVSSTLHQRLASLSGLVAAETGERLAQLAAEVPEELAIVELGAFKGKSACYLASASKAHVYSIDAWDLTGNVSGKRGYATAEVFEAYKRQITEMGFADRITYTKNFSYKAAVTWSKPIGLLFIDASHLYNDVKRDYEDWCNFLTPGSTVVFDDYGGPNKGVTQFVDELRKSGVLEEWDFNTLPLAIAKVPKASKIQLSTVIMAHPKRERHIPYLQRKLQNAPVIWDTINNRWDTGRRSMLAYDKNSTHHLVVQDDALVCEDFIGGVTKALEAIPYSPVSLYTGKVRPLGPIVQQLVNRAVQARRTWIRMDGPQWGVAVVVPVQYIDEMIAYCDKLTQIANYDLRMVRFFQHKQIKCFYTIPSLVSHRVGPGEPSLVPGRGSGDSRVAHNFIGENTSALSVRWTRSFVS